jgi:hypothetical protein
MAVAQAPFFQVSLCNGSWISTQLRLHMHLHANAYLKRIRRGTVPASPPQANGRPNHDVFRRIGLPHWSYHIVCKQQLPAPPFCAYGLYSSRCASFHHLGRHACICFGYEVRADAQARQGTKTAKGRDARKQLRLKTQGTKMEKTSTCSAGDPIACLGL